MTYFCYPEVQKKNYVEILFYASLCAGECVRFRLSFIGKSKIPRKPSAMVFSLQLVELHRFYLR